MLVEGEKIKSAALRCSVNASEVTCDMKDPEKNNTGARLLRRRPSACHGDPFGHAAPLLALDINDISITLASATNAVLLNCVPRFPVFVFLNSLFLISGGLLKERRPCKLPITRRVCWAMLDRGMSVTYVPEVVYVFRSQ